MRVVIAEDLFLLREGLASLLKAHGFEIAGAVSDEPSLLRALIDLKPDVAIVDVRLPPTQTDEGLRAALAARRQVPGLPILVLSAHVEQLYARELLADQAGGVGYLLKDRVFTDEQFTDALRTVAHGERSWTRRWSRSCWPGVPTNSPVPGSPTGNAKYSR